MKYTKLFSFMIVLLFMISNASAVVYVDYEFREGIIQTNNNLIPTNIPVNNVDVIGFVCSDQGCNSVSSSLFGGTISNPTVLSSSVDSIQLVYPTTLQSPFGYGIYFYKDDYVPWAVSADWRGNNNPNNPVGPNAVYLSKLEQCSAPIDNFSVLNEVNPNQPVQIDVNAMLDANIRNILRYSGLLGFVPPSISDQYQLEVEVNVEIFDDDNNVVFSQNEVLNLDPEEVAQVSYTWVPTVEGDYSAVASTDVTDGMCLNSVTLSTSQDVSVIPGPPINMCYTLLDNLALSDPSPDVGDLVTISAEKISNEADSNGILSALATDVVLTITNLNTGSVQVINNVIPANPDIFNFVPFSFSWLVSQAGNYLIELYAVANNCAYSQNLDDSAAIGVLVSAPQCSDGIDNDGDGLVDVNDPGCYNANQQYDPNDNDESNSGSPFECSDTVDNDGDGLIDYPADPGCSSLFDDNEIDSAPAPQCSDGIDNDGDGAIDFPNDFGCDDSNDDDEINNGNTECSDGIDNDGDGDIDQDDNDCSSPIDDNEGIDTSGGDRGGGGSSESLSIELVSVYPSGVSCGDNFDVDVVVVNDGSRDLKNVYVTVDESSLDIYEKSVSFDLDEDKSREVRFSTNIGDVEEKEYRLIIMANLENGKVADSVTKTLKVNGCDGVKGLSGITGFSVDGLIDKGEKDGFFASISKILDNPLSLLAIILAILLLLLLVIYVGRRVSNI